MTVSRLHLPSRYHGRVQVRCGDAVAEGHNDVTYQGGDILAALMAGHPEYKISHAYLEFANTEELDSGSFSRSDTAASRQAVSEPYDLLRAPLIAVPLIEAADEDHDGNRATYLALSNSASGLIHDLDFTAEAGSQIYAACLVAAPGGSDHLQDLVYARYILDSVIPVTGLGQVTIAWMTDFT